MSIDTSSILFTKIVVMVVLTTTSFLCGTVPLLISRFYEKKTHETIDPVAKVRAQKKRDRIVSLLVAFAGGVLFCTVFIHLLPEVNETFTDLRQEERYKDYPGFIAEALLCGGFFIMYFSEEIAHKVMHTNKKQEVPKEGPDSDVHVVSMNVLPSVENENRYALSYKNTVFFNNIMSITEDAAQDLSSEERGRIVTLIKKALSDKNEDVPTISSVDLRRPSQLPHDMELVTSKSRGLRSFLLLLALSIHAVFEGMAIGLETKIASVWLMLLGVAAHKMVLTAVMAIEMVAAGIGPVVHMIYVIFFALISTVGIGIGLVISSQEDVLAAVFQGIAGGTLVYVLFFEILERSNTEHNNTAGFLAFFMVVLGFALMLTLQIVADT